VVLKGEREMKKLLKKRLSAILFILSLLFATVDAQKLPNLRVKPKPKYEEPSFCPKEGSPGSDTEMNMAKNRIDKATRYFPVDFDEVKNLHSADFLAEKDRDKINAEDKKAIQKFEGIPIRLEGFLLLVKDGNKMVGGIKEGKESTNCKMDEFEHVDYHMWLIKSPTDELKDAIVIEMTPRVKSKHVRWSNEDFLETDLNFIANQKIPIRVYGWLFFDGEHKEQMFDPDNPNKLRVRRATLWEIHPIMKIELKQNGRWREW
jgi:hypothetical protein